MNYFYRQDRYILYGAWGRPQDFSISAIKKIVLSIFRISDIVEDQ